ncbi:MAG: hypothetical protein KGQ61_03445 [Planctomycetes bacterium]|nr:hypothetical protein [Planctomycetota bacterium]
MNRRHVTLPIRVLVALALGSAGCGRSVAPREVEEPTHHRPAHHPGSLAAAPPAIRARAARLVAAPADAAAATAELRDILRWIPQLAADTELPRGAWDDVAALAARGSARLAAPGDPTALAADLAATADRLAAIVATLPPGTPAEEP